MTKPIPTHDGHICTVCWQLLHHNIIITSEYISSAHAGYKSVRTESQKVKHLRSGTHVAK